MSQLSNYSSAVDRMPSDERTQLLMKMRAEQFAKQKVKAEKPSESIRYIVFLMEENQLYGMPFPHIAEVMNEYCITKVPFTNSDLSGVINWRGVLIPVIDLTYLFFKKNAPDESNMIILALDKIQVGVLVGKIQGSDAYDPSTLDPPLLIETALSNQFVTGIHQHIVTIINSEALIKAISKRNQGERHD